MDTMHLVSVLHAEPSINQFGADDELSRKKKCCPVADDELTREICIWIAVISRVRIVYGIQSQLHCWVPSYL